MSGSVTGNAGGDDHFTLHELVLYPSEYIARVGVKSGSLSLETNFHRALSCPFRGELTGGGNFSRSHFRSLHADDMIHCGTAMKWIVRTASATARGSGDSSLPRSVRARYCLVKDAYVQFTSRQPQLASFPEKKFARMLKRLFCIHGAFAAVESRELVPSRSIATLAAKFSLVLQNITLCVHKWTRFYISTLARAKLLDDAFSSFAELESEFDNLVVAERASGFATGIQQKHSSAIRALVQAAVDERNFDLAAVLCLRGGEAGADLMNQIVQLVADLSQDHTIQAPGRETVLAVSAKLNSALHVAARKHLFHVIELLLVQVRVNPLVRTVDGKRAIDLVGELSTNEMHDDKSTRIFYLLDQCTKANEFQRRATALLKSGIVTRSALEELLPNMTAVQDLQVLFTIGPSSLTPNEFKQLLRLACEHVISRKLVFDDEAAVYFKLGLKQCYSKGYLSKAELEYWRIKTSQVNMESAPWVTEMKATIQKLQVQLSSLETKVHLLKKHFETLRTALLQKEEEEQQRARRQKIVSLVSLGLVLVGGPVIKEFLHGVMDLTDPVHLLSATLELNHHNEVVTFCANDVAKVVFREGIEAILARSDIQPQEFASVLKNAVILEHPEYFADPKVAPPPSCEQARLSIQTLSGSGELPDEPLTTPHRVSEAYGRPCQGKEEQHRERPPTARDYATQQLADFPYHYAVQQSKGDMSKFLELLAFVEQERYDVNQAHRVIVKVLDPTTSEYTRLRLPPYVFASYLGYEDIVKSFLGRKDFKPVDGGERIVVTVNRVRKVARIVSSLGCNYLS